MSNRPHAKGVILPACCAFWIAMWNQDAATRLGSAISALRTSKGMSQESLAHAAGITKNQVQLIEAGKASGRKDDSGSSNPRITTLVGLADALETSAAELLAAARV